MREEDNRTYWVEIYVPGKGLAFREEAVMARDLATGRITALGTAAREQQAAGMEDAMFYAGAKKVKLTEEPAGHVLYQEEPGGVDLILAIRSEEW